VSEKAKGYDEKEQGKSVISVN